MLAQFTIAATGGWQAWTTLTATAASKYIAIPAYSRNVPWQKHREKCDQCGLAALGQPGLAMPEDILAMSCETGKPLYAEVMKTI